MRRLLMTAVAAAALAGVGLGLAAGTTRSPTVRMAAALSLQQRAGERVIYSYRGLEPPRSLVAQIRRGEAAGVIFFKGNVASLAQIRRVVARLQAAAMKSPVKLPLLMLTDQEGGEVRRLSAGPALSEKQIGASVDPATQAGAAGHAAGMALAAAGLNVNLAPVLDVYRRAGDFIDRYGRSYSNDPARVASLGSDFIRAQQRLAVAATAKHFPGLGSAARQADTDNRPVTLTLSRSALRTIDERPYRVAIAAHVRLVMVSWAIYPALDPGRPAGLSAAVVQHELRGRLRFGGVTISDALEAGALRRYGGTARRAVLAARAGIDLLLCAGHDVSQGMQAVDALSRGLATGHLDRSAFTNSVGRVLALRQSLRKRAA